ncbi:AfsR/SARP family transcriptional regulator [Streptomyces sp. MK5]|uniref:AfsR/SARP family transcriptional regulator n=1 Tax=Streptomyces sp. MK5 TaxID=3064253 RepID=UPI002742290D|nr:AfsR/SARP family transcriptional regulator [Streptomyces sp. MK5]
MRFRLLGPLQVEPQTPSAAKLRTALAALLVGANTVVSTDNLVDELWGADPPRTVTTTLQVYISQLRKLLSAGADDGIGRAFIETRPPGYMFHTDPEDLDLHAFEDLRARGEEAYSRGKFAAAGEALHAALGLWRGPALTGVVRGQRLEAAASRLQLLKTESLEQRIAVDVWLGRHRRLTGELTGLVEEYPLRETLHAHLIVALYRSNRQSEALTVYERIRRSLAEEMGIDPGHALRELHQRVLRSEPITHFDECLDGRAVVEVRSAPAPVVRLPRPARGMTGRDGQLEAAEAQLRGAGGVDPVHVLGITGAAGVGKTAFAVELARRTADRHPGGQVFVSLRGADGEPLHARAVLLRLLRLLRTGPECPSPDPDAGIDELSDLLQVTVAGRLLLLVLDDASCAAQIEPVTAAATASTVVITSRKPVSGLDGTRTFPLPPLTTDAAVELLRAQAGVPLEVDSATHIARLCGCSPLALRSAATALARHPRWSGAGLRARLADERARLDVLALGDQDVRGRLLTGYRELDDAERHAFRMLALAPQPDVAPWCAAALLGTTADHVERAVEGLVRAGLLGTRPSGGGQVRYVGDGLSRALAAELLAERDPQEIRRATTRLCTAYRALARYADDLLSPGARETGGPGAGEQDHPDWLVPHQAVGATPLRWFAEERAGIAATLRRAHDAGLWQLTWTLAEAFLRYLEAGGEWEEWDGLARLALTAARRAGDPSAEASILCSQGALAWQRRQFVLAGTHYEAARSRALEASARRTEARALIGLADVALGLGGVVKAGRIYAKASLLCRAEGDLRGLADARRGLAFAALRCGDPATALQRLAECEQAAGELRDRRWHAYARRAAAGLRLGSVPGDPLELRPGVWEIGEPAARSAL